MSDIEIGARRIFLSETAREIEIVGQVTEGQFAGEFRYRYVADPARHGILSAEFLLSSTKPAPTAPSDHGPLPNRAAPRTTAEALNHLAPRRRVARTMARRFSSLIRRVRGIRFTRPSFVGSILPRPTEPVFRAAVTLLIGLTLGYGYHAMTLQAPPDCAKAFTLADRTFVDYENVSTAVVLMSTRGQSEYEGHEADAIQLWDDIDAARAEYRVAKASCLGADS